MGSIGDLTVKFLLANPGTQEDSWSTPKGAGVKVCVIHSSLSSKFSINWIIWITINKNQISIILNITNRPELKNWAKTKLIMISELAWGKIWFFIADNITSVTGKILSYVRLCDQEMRDFNREMRIEGGNWNHIPQFIRISQWTMKGEQKRLPFKRLKFQFYGMVGIWGKRGERLLSTERLGHSGLSPTGIFIPQKKRAFASLPFLLSSFAFFQFCYCSMKVAAVGNR